MLRRISFTTVVSVAWFSLACESSDAPGKHSDATDAGGGAGEPLDVPTMRSLASAASGAMSAFLSELVQYPSVEPVEGSADDPLPEASEAALQAVLDEGASFGMAARRSKNGRVGILEYGTGDETVGAVVHLDVVPAGDESAWTHGPFSGDIVDGEVWGRGAQDDKGAGVSTLWAARMLIGSKVHFPRKLRLIFGTSEEVEFSRDIIPYFEEEGPPDLGIVPDGLYIGNGEAGYMDAVLTFNGASGKVARDRAVFMSGGQAVNAVPEFAYVVFESDDPAALRQELEALVPDVATRAMKEANKEVALRVQTRAAFVAEHPDASVPAGDVVLSSKGVAFHSSVPQLGRNAIVEVALVCAGTTHLAEGAIANATRFIGASLGFTVDGSLLGFEQSGAGQQTSFSLDLASTKSADGTVELIVNTRRRVNVASNDAIASAFEQALSGVDSRVTTRGDVLPGYDIPADDPLLELVATSYETVLGEAPAIGPNSGASYVQAAPSNLTLYGPVIVSKDALHFHAVDERVTVESLERNAALYAHALQEMLLAKEAPARTAK